MQINNLFFSEHEKKEHMSCQRRAPVLSVPSDDTARCFQSLIPSVCCSPNKQLLYKIKGFLWHADMHEI